MLVNKKIDSGVSHFSLNSGIQQPGFCEKIKIESDPHTECAIQDEIVRSKVEIEHQDVQSVFSRSFEEQKEFILSVSPEEWYPMVRKKGRISVDIPEEQRQVENVIYIFRNKITGRCLIGKTEQKLHKRLSAYYNKFNNPEIIGSEFVSHATMNPKNFEFGILYRVQPDEDIDQVEEAFIDHYRAAGRELYNQKRGGAGGRAQSSERGSFYAIPNTEEFPSPEKDYPVVFQNGKLKILTSPGLRKKIKANQLKAGKNGHGFSHAYRFKMVQKGRVKKTDMRVKRYIGITGGNGGRLQQHCSNAKRGKTNLERALNERKGKFVANIIPVKYIDPNTLTPKRRSRYVYFRKIGDVEKALIKKAKESGEVYNAIDGGGGPRARPAHQKKYI